MLDDEDLLPALSSLSNKYGSVNKHSEEDPQDVQGIADLKTLTVLAVGTVIEAPVAELQLPLDTN